MCEAGRVQARLRHGGPPAPEVAGGAGPGQSGRALGRDLWEDAMTPGGGPPEGTEGTETLGAAGH